MKKIIFTLFLVSLFSCSNSDDDTEVEDTNGIIKTAWVRFNNPSHVGVPPYDVFEFLNSTDFALTAVKSDGIVSKYLLIGKYTQEEGRINCICHNNNYSDFFPSNEFSMIINPDKQTIHLESNPYIIFLKQLHFPKIE